MLMTTWIQNYDPTGNIWLSALVAVIPIAFFFLALTKLKMKAITAGAYTLAITIVLAILFYKMPITMTLSSAVYGFGFGLFPIAWIIIAAVFLYKVTVNTGQFDIIRTSVVSITDDQRLQVILIGFAFGSFLEGAAGFGAPVAITASLLVGLGFQPLYAAGLCLIANTAPVAFGAMGVPILTAANVSGTDANLVGSMAGHTLPILSLFVPFFLVFLMDGFKGVRQTWPAVLVAGGSFAITQFFTSSMIGYELPDITSAIVCIFALTIFLKFWKPKESFKFNSDKAVSTTNGNSAATKKLSFGVVAKAWSPFILLTVIVILWTQEWMKNILDFLTFKFEMPGLHNLVMKATPLVEENTPYEAEYTLNILTAVGTAIFLTALISIVILGMNWKNVKKTIAETHQEVKIPVLTIGIVLAFAYVCNYSGLSATLALALAETGQFFVFLSPILGWLGVFLTGSDTSANALFGNLQAITAAKINVDPILLVSANSVGGVCGKMISPQSIAIACAAVGMVGRESELFKFTVKYSIMFVLFIGIITVIQAYVLPGWIPTEFPLFSGK